MGNICKKGARTADNPVPINLVAMRPVTPVTPFNQMRTIKEVLDFGIDKTQLFYGENLTFMEWMIKTFLKNVDYEFLISWEEILEWITVVPYLLNLVVKESATSTRTARLTLVERLISIGVEVDYEDAVLKAPLYCAVEQGDIRLCEFLMQSGAHPDHLAKAIDKSRIFQLLFEKGASVRDFDEHGECVVSHLVKKNKIDLLKIVANSDQDLDGFSVDRNGVPVIAYATHPEIVAVLLQNGADANSLDGTGTPVLVQAVSHNRLEIVKLLLDAGANANCQNFAGQHVIQIAVDNDNTAILDELIMEGGDTSSIPNNTSLLSTAIVAGNTPMASILLDTGISPDFQIDDTERALSFSIVKGNYELTRLLLDHNVQIHAKALDYAVVGGVERIVRLLINRGADASKLDKESLITTIKNDRYSLLEFLVISGANINNSSILKHVLQLGNENFLLLMLSNGFSPNRYISTLGKLAPKHNLNCTCILCHAPDDNCTPLYLTIRYKQPVLCRVLLDNGADPCLTSSVHKNTPLHLAMRFYNHEMEPIIRMLVDSMIEIDQVNKYGQTALHRFLANSKGQGIDICRSLLEKGADPNRCTKQGNNALHIAVEKSSEGIVELLLEHGATTNVPNKAGKTAVQLARSQAVKKMIGNGLGINVPKIYYSTLCNICEERPPCVLLPCYHCKMCKECEKDWKTNTCPDCRRPYSKGQIIELHIELIEE